MSNYLQDEGCVHLILCFLDPTKMLRTNKAPTKQHALKSEQVHCTDAYVDPLYQLFEPDKFGTAEQSRVEAEKCDRFFVLFVFL